MKRLPLSFRNSHRRAVPTGFSETANNKPRVSQQRAELGEGFSTHSQARTVRWGRLWNQINRAHGRPTGFIFPGHLENVARACCAPNFKALPPKVDNAACSQSSRNKLDAAALHTALCIEGQSVPAKNTRCPCLRPPLRRDGWRCRWFSRRGKDQGAPPCALRNGSPRRLIT